MASRLVSAIVLFFIFLLLAIAILVAFEWGGVHLGVDFPKFILDYLGFEPAAGLEMSQHG